MSTTVDQRVVEMRFDNKQFEQNVATTITSLEKLKQSSNLSGAAKGVETFQEKFSAMEVVAVTALANITNSALNAGKRIASALTIDPIKTGFDEYETKIGAIQTIMSNTASKGTTMADVTKVIGELNEYADKTIYNFSEMTRNIGTFTAAGVGLEESAAAIQGIANLAAASGSTSQQASTAMYQLSQALAAGTVKLMDWNSVVNAGMGGEKFQEALKATAREYGIDVDSMIEANGSFRESLQEGWITADVLNTTLQKFTTKGANDYAEAMLASGKYTQEQAEALKKEALAMEEAATKVKTFTQLWDTLKESAQSGWAQTWELIVGDFEEAKDLFSELSTIFGGIIEKSANARNALLESALGSRWDELQESISETGIAADDFIEKLKETAREHNVAIDEMIETEGSFEATLKKGWLSGSLISETLRKFIGGIENVSTATSTATAQLEELQDVVNRVIRGDFGNGAERMKALADAGYDYATVQNLVNTVIAGGTIQLEGMTEAQLESLGYTEDQIRMIQKLADEAERAGTPISELIETIEKPSGRQLLLEALMNAVNGVVAAFESIKRAWDDTFSIEPDELYGAIAALNEFSKNLIITDETADKLYRTFKGVFAVLDIFATITGGILKVGLEVLCTLLGLTTDDILELTASVGDAVVAFRDWVDEHNVLKKAAEKAAPVVEKFALSVRDWIVEFYNLPVVQENIARFNTAFKKSLSDLKDHLHSIKDKFTEFIERVKAMDSLTLEDLDDIFRDFRDNVLGYAFDIDGRFDDLKQAFADFKISVKEHMESTGEGFVNAKNKVVEFFSVLRSKISENIGIGEILTIGIGGALVATVSSLGKSLKLIADGISGFNGIISSFGGVLTSAQGALKAFSTELKSKALLNVAFALAVLTGSLAVLTLLDQSKLLTAGVTLGILAAGLVALSYALGKLDTFGGVSKGAATIIALSAAVGILVSSMKAIEGLDQERLPRTLLTLAGVLGGLVVAVGVLGKLAPQLSKGAFTLLALSVSIKIVASAISDLNSIDIQDPTQTVGLLIGAIGSLVLLAVACKAVVTTNLLQAGIGIIAMVLGLKVLIDCFDDITKLDTTAIRTNLEAFVAIFGMFAVLMAASNLAGTNALKAGLGIIGMSAALLIIIRVIKQMADVDPLDLDRASDTVAKLLLVFAGVMALSNFAGANAVKAGAMLLMMSGAILILSAVIVVLSHIDPSGLGRAIGAIALLEICFGMLIAVTSLAQECKSTLVLISVTIGILAIALGTLAMINPDNLATASASLAAVMGMFAVLVASTSFAKTAYGTIVVMALVVAALGGVLYLLSGLPAESTLAIAESLSLLLISLSGACLILSGVGASGANALIGVGVLAGVVAALGLLIGGVGALVTEFPMLEEFLNRGIPVLESIGYALGSFAGNIIGGISGGATAGLPQVGEHLSAFMSNASEFFDGIRNIDSAAMTGVKALAETILVLTAADILNGISKFFVGETSLATFGEQIADFGQYIKTYAESVSGISNTDVEASANAAKTLAEFASAVPNSGGLIAGIVGENSLAEFAEQLIPFGKSFAKYSAVISGVDSDAVQNSANAAAVLAEFASAVPNTGGALAALIGDNTLSAFADELVAFGPSLKAYADSVVGLDADVVSNSTNAALALAQMADKLPNQNGALAAFVGDNTLSAFASELALFGPSLKAYADSVVGLDSAVVTNSVNAAQTLAAFASNLPNAGGIVSWFTGDNDISAFGENLVSFGQSFAEYSSHMKNVDAGIVSSTTNAAMAIVRLQNSLPEDGGWFSDTTSLADFGSDMTMFGLYFANFYGYIKDIDTNAVVGATAAVNNIVAMAKGMVGLDTTGMTSFSIALTALANGSITSFTTAFENAVPIMVTAITDYMTTLSITVASYGATLNASMNSIVMMMISTVRAGRASFYQAGIYMVDGLIAGLEARRAAAISAARALAAAVSSAVSVSLDINSPSGVFEDFGMYSVLGLAKGLNKYAYLAENSATNLADETANGMSVVVGQIADSLNGDMDLTPTIRPVVDLTDVEKGAKLATKTLGIQTGLRVSGITARVSAVSTSVANKNTPAAAITGEKVSQTTNYNYTQNNYSPKSLSRLDIYRQTKNQFSALKGAVK